MDVYSPEDVYSQSLWTAAETYFGGLSEREGQLPGGRYACGVELAARGPPFLRGLSLGQICHVVQLAISQKKLLGYQGNAVVPYERSQSMVKDRCAQDGRPCPRGLGGAVAVSWDLVRACLRDILQTEASNVPLSNVKRLFRSRFQLELSETALGHSKLSELLQDARLADLCCLRLQGSGYVVAPREAIRTLDLVQALADEELCAQEQVQAPEWHSEDSGAQRHDDHDSQSDAVGDEDDFDAAVAAFHAGGTEVLDSCASLECPWGPTPDGSFIGGLEPELLVALHSPAEVRRRDG